MEYVKKNGDTLTEIIHACIDSCPSAGGSAAFIMILPTNTAKICHHSSVPFLMNSHALHAAFTVIVSLQTSREEAVHADIAALVV